MTTIDRTLPSDTLADLAARHAGASRVFARHRLDFCCKGQISLAEACSNRALDVDALILELEAERPAREAAVDWSTRPLWELTDHIVERFHEPHRCELPRLIAMAARVEMVHADKPACPHGLADLLRRFTAELELHMEKEEQVLFPMIARGTGRFAGPPIRVMLQEHESAGEQLEKLRALTGDHQPPAEACGTWRALYLGLEEFELELMNHVHLENHVLFPAALAPESV